MQTFKWLNVVKTQKDTYFGNEICKFCLEIKNVATQLLPIAKKMGDIRNALSQSESGTHLCLLEIPLN